MVHRAGLHDLRSAVFQEPAPDRGRHRGRRQCSSIEPLQRSPPTLFSDLPTGAWARCAANVLSELRSLEQPAVPCDCFLEPLPLILNEIGQYDSAGKYEVLSGTWIGQELTTTLEYRRKARKERQAAHAQREEKLIAAANLRRERREERIAKKNARHPVRAAEVATFVEQLGKLEPTERVDAILSSTLPIDVIPGAQLDEIAAAIDKVPQPALMILLRKIDRRKRGAWARLKRAISQRLETAGRSA